MLFISLVGSWILEICRVGDEGEDDWLLFAVNGFEKRYELLDAVFVLFVVEVLLFVGLLVLVAVEEFPLLTISH